jgi:hypothetical protein
MKNDKQNLKLTIELVPETSWTNNVRKIVSTKQWDKIRKESYQKYNYKCGICNAEGRLSCHEIWNYDEETHIQKLMGFIALCTPCHNIKHIGFSQILADEGKLDLNKLIEHFCKVNNCNLDTYADHHEMAFSTWRERSKHDWKIDFGEYANIINDKSSGKR